MKNLLGTLMILPGALMLVVLYFVRGRMLYPEPEKQTSWDDEDAFCATLSQAQEAAKK